MDALRPHGCVEYANPDGSVCPPPPFNFRNPLLRGSRPPRKVVTTSPLDMMRCQIQFDTRVRYRKGGVHLSRRYDEPLSCLLFPFSSQAFSRVIQASMRLMTDPLYKWQAPLPSFKKVTAPPPLSGCFGRQGDPACMPHTTNLYGLSKSMIF